jgi:acetolactate synthase-1/2/3 large subunit
MAETTVAESVIEYLKSRDVRHIFGILAHTSFALGDAIAKRPQIRFVNAQHEGGAGNMALGYARATKKPAVCLVSAGGGATNITTAVAQAHKESVPLFIMSSDIGTASSSKGAFSSWHGMDHVGLFQPITKQSLKLERVEQLGSVLDSLFRLTTTGRPGPVFTILPADIQSATLPEPINFSPTSVASTPAIDARSAEKAIELLLAARAPAILAGTGVDWSNAAPEVQELAELLAAPVATSYTAKGVFPENHPLALGCLGGGGRPYAREIFLKSDLVLAVGTTFSEGTTLGFAHRTISQGSKIIQIDIDPAELGRNYPTELAIQADAKAALRSIIDGLKSRNARSRDSGRVEQIRESKAAWRSDLENKTANGALTYDFLLKTLNGLLTGAEMLVTSGMTGDLLRNIDAVKPIIHAGEFRAIGTALATSLGVKLGMPNARVVCVTGDGSFMMEQQELATARFHNIPVMVLVLRNNAYGGMRRDQKEHYGGRIIGTELFIPDLARLGELFGAKGYSITKSEDVRPTLQRALATDDFAVVDVAVQK